jgi:outer membrane protein assembly factor BamE
MIHSMKATTRTRLRPPRTVRITTLLGVTTLGLSLLLGAGCVYRLPIQQGNHLDAETVAQVRAGMTRTQVRYLLGTPIVPGGFESDRWDYDYYLKLRRLQTPQRAHATVYFKADLVERVVSNVDSKIVEPVSKRPVSAPGS